MTQGVYTDLKYLIRLKFQGQGFSFLPRQPVHSVLAGQKASRLRGRGLNFEEIRDYLPGDDIRNIDWKVTARMRKPHVRVYTEERNRPVLLIVDQRLNMFFGSKRAMKSVAAAEVAALAAWRVVAVGDRVGALVFNDHEVDEIAPRAGNNAVMHILKAIVRRNTALSATSTVDPDPGRLNEVLKKAVRLAKHDALVCIVSDFDGADEETGALLTRISQHNDVIAGMIFDPLEAELPELSRLIVGDGSLQIEFDARDASIRDGFATVFSGRLEQLGEFFRKRQIPLLSIETGLPVAGQIRRQLGMRPGQAAR